MGLLCNWFDDWGRSIQNALGKTWLAGVFAICIFISLFFLQYILRASINKNKIKIRWGSVIMLIIFVLLSVWSGYLLFNMI